MKENGFFGELMVPQEDHFPYRCMIVFGGSAGSFLLTQLVGDCFMDAGLSAMLIAYHGEEGLPVILKDQPVDVIEHAAQYLLSHGYAKAGVWGISMGGELALLAGSLLPDLISCVVSIAPLQMVMQAEDNKVPVTGSSFSFHGESLPCAGYVPSGKAWKKKFMQESWKHHEPYTKQLLLDAYYSDHDKKAEIQVENIHGPVLLLGSAMDSMCPDEETLHDLTQRLKEKGFPFPYQSVIYPHLSHYITPVKPISARMFKAERKYPKECDAERKQSFEDTLSFLREYWVNGI